jgi:hypothetical protein
MKNPKLMVPSVIYVSILKRSVLSLYFIVPSKYSCDDSHSTEETLDYVQDSTCLEGVHCRVLQLIM